MPEKRSFHIRLTPKTIQLARELASKLNFEYARNPATGMFLEFAIHFINESVEGRYQWLDTQTQSTIDPVALAQEFRDSNSNSNN